MFYNKAFRLSIKHALSVFFIAAATAVSAQNWTGNVNSDWNNAANWTGWPLNGDDILIDPVNYTGVAASPVISANSVFTPDGMIVQNGATLTIQASLTTAGRIELFNNGTLVNIAGGMLFASGAGSQGRFIVSDGAAVLQTGGLAKANQRIIVELGGLYTLNSGTVNPIQELAIGDGNATASSLFDMNGGLVTMTQGLGFENEAGLYEPTFNMSSGTLSVGGDVSWLGAAPGAGTPRFIMSGGTATVGGSILNDPLTTVNLYLHLSGTASMAFNGPAMTLVNPADSIIQSGNCQLTLSGTHIISNPGVWHSTGGSTIFNGNTTLQGTGSYCMNHITVNSTRTLNHASPLTFSITGNFTNDGSFVPNNNTIVFAGATTQIIGGSTLTGFRNLTALNTSTAGITLNNAITLTGNLQLTTGRLNSSAVNLLTLTDNATSSPGSASSFVNGPIRKIGNDAFVFPVGKNNRWRRISISAPASVTSEFVAEYFNTFYPALSPVNAPLQAVTNIEYWNLNRLNSTDAVQAALYWEDALASAITTCTQLNMAYWNGTSWNDLPSASTGSCNGNGAGTLQSNAALGSFGYFTFGFSGIVTPQNITICNGDSIVVGTNTYSSTGTYVDVLTAINASDSTVITQLNVLAAIIKTQSASLCAGSSFTVGSNIYNMTGNYSDTLVSAFGCDSIVNTALVIKSPVNVSVLQNDVTLSASNTNAAAYQWVDCSANFLPVPGETAPVFTASLNGSYAVIISDGDCADTSACFSIMTVDFAEHQPTSQWKVYPNPGPGKIAVQTGQTGTIRLRLFDLTGRLVDKTVISEASAGYDFSAQPDGVYVLELAEGRNVLRVKLIKQS